MTEAGARFDQVFFTPPFYAQILKLIAITHKPYLEGLIIGQVTTEQALSTAADQGQTSKLRPVAKTLSQEFNDLDSLSIINQSAVLAPRNLICGAILPFPEPSVFYDKNGDVDMKLIDKLESYLVAQSADFQSFKIIGWYKLRRDTPHSMLYSIEKRVCANMINRAGKKGGSCPPEPLVFVLNTTESHSESGVGARMLISEQHQAFVFDKSDSSSYRTVPIQIQNIASINLRRNGDTSRPHDQAESGVDDHQGSAAKAEGQDAAASVRCLSAAAVKFDDPQMKLLSEQVAGHLVEAYKGVQAMCEALNVKLRGLVDNLVKQELALLDSIEPTMQHDETSKLDAEEQSVVWKAKLGEIYKEAIMKSIADELSF